MGSSWAVVAEVASGMSFVSCHPGTMVYADSFRLRRKDDSIFLLPSLVIDIYIYIYIILYNSFYVYIRISTSSAHRRRGGHSWLTREARIC